MNCFELIIAFSAFLVALVTAIIQIKVHRQELRPYLSFSGTTGIVKIFTDTGKAGMDILINLMNVGKCVLVYEVSKFDVFVNGVKLPDVDVTNKGSVIGVNTGASYRKYYEGILQYSERLSPEQYIPPNHKIVFDIEYYKVNKPTKRYKLSYEVSLEFSDGIRREFYDKTYSD